MKSREIFEELANRYDAWYDEAIGQVIFHSEVECLRPLLAGLPRPHLEVGVGSGRFASALGVEMGLDPARSMLRLARQRGLKVVQGVGEQLPFPDGTFGAVLLVVTLCFVADPVLVLKQSARVLKPGGAIILGLVLRESPWAEAYLEKGRQGHPIYEAARFYPFREVKEMLEAAGLEIRRCRSALPGKPGEAKPQEKIPDHYMPEAGFTCLLAECHPRWERRKL